jgi:hypothetical protein
MRNGDSRKRAGAAESNKLVDVAGQERTTTGRNTSALLEEMPRLIFTSCKGDPGLDRVMKCLGVRDVASAVTRRANGFLAFTKKI